MGGGPTALYVGVLEARGIGDAVHRVTVVERVMASSAVRSRTARARSQALAKDAEALDVAADEAVVTARDVEAEWVRLQQLLADGTQRLAVLTERARATEEAERAAAALAELRRRVAATMAARVATARAVTVPGGYFALYRRAATSCPGLPWTVLGAIGQVETGHGRNVGPSSAGAMGPMQFMPATWAAYAVDGDRDGDADILDPVDSVYTAARYLCANGAGRGGATLARAIWHYNHAEWYVQLVLRIAAQLAVKPPAA
jgi:membrane-bound lytic murein transglycosylase B